MQAAVRFRLCGILCGIYEAFLYAPVRQVHGRVFYFRKALKKAQAPQKLRGLRLLKYQRGLYFSVVWLHLLRFHFSAVVREARQRFTKTAVGAVRSKDRSAIR